MQTRGRFMLQIDTAASRRLQGGAVGSVRQPGGITSGGSTGDTTEGSTNVHTSMWSHMRCCNH